MKITSCLILPTPNLFIMVGKPIAVVGGTHVCPMVTGTTPHVGGPIIGPGASNVLINGKPAALLGDSCTCVGTPDTIVQGEAAVLINDTPVATAGSMTAHGGSVTVGDATVLISSATPNTKVYTPLPEIPFPKVTRVQLAVNGLKDAVTGSSNVASLKEAQAAQDRVSEEAKKYGELPDMDFSI